MLCSYNCHLVILIQTLPVAAQATADFMKVISTSEPLASRPAVTPAQAVTTAALSKPGPTLVKVRTHFSTSKLSVFHCMVPLQRFHITFGYCLSLLGTTTEVDAKKSTWFYLQRLPVENQKRQVESNWCHVVEKLL